MNNALRFFLIGISALTLAAQSLHLKTREISTATQAAGVDANGFGKISPVSISGNGHWLVQFSQEPTAEVVAALRQQGVRVLADVPENGLLVVANGAMDLSSLGARFTSTIPAADKVSPLVSENFLAGRNSLQLTDGADRMMLIELHPDVDANQVRGQLLRMGVTPRDNPDLHSQHLMISVDGAAAKTLSSIAALDEVSYIFPASNELAKGVTSRACNGAITFNGPMTQATATYGDGWDGPGRGAASLTYVYGKMTSRLDVTAAKAEIQRAMAEWSKVINVRWTAGTNANGTKTINIFFATGSHGDGYPFDTQGGVLAHTFYPAGMNPEPIAGDFHLDDAENWKIGVNTDLFSVSLHELGHALGLGHSDNPNSVMYPYYKMVTTLSEEDKSTVLKLYAASTGNNTPTSNPPANPPSNPTNPPANPTAAPLSLTVNAPAATTTAASISLTGSANGGTGAIAITWTAGSASGVATGTAAAWSVNVALAMGANNVTVTATASGASVSKSFTITRTAENNGDKTAPTVTLTSPSTGTATTAAATFALRGTANDNKGVTSITWATNFGASGTASGTTSWSASIPLLKGANTVTVRAFDAAGNSSWRTAVITRQ